METLARNGLNSISAKSYFFHDEGLSCRNQFIDLLCKSMDWFQYDRDIRYERVNISLKKNLTPAILDACK